MIRAEGLVVEVGGRRVVDGATFTVAARDKVGLVGRNGAGKTSMFKVLGGEAEPIAGKVVRSGRFGYLSQDPRTGGEAATRSAIDHVLSGRGIAEERERLEKLRVAMEERPDDANVARFSKAEEDFRAKGGYFAEAEARSIAHGLGLPGDRLGLALGSLSGGQRRRVELARILFGGTDCLLLDEPTNHLDVDAKTWLLGFLRAYRGALLVISHDLDLLDEAITRVLHLDRPAEEASGNVVEYRGTYSQYKAARAADEERARRMMRTQSREIDRLRTVVDRFGAKASKATMAHSIEKRIARLEADLPTGAPAVEGTGAMRVRFPVPPRPGATVVEVSGLSKNYGGPPVFDDVTFDLGRGEILLVIGLNGAGKTSMLRILAGVSEASSGSVRWGHNVHVGYFAQEHDLLDPGRTLLDHMRREMPPGSGLTETDLRGMLGAFRLSGDKVHQETGTLSGGEKTKLSLAMSMVGRNNVLLLDEPTNNLDPPSREAVGAALAGWEGSIILVSHDTEFVSTVAPDKVLVLPEGQVDYFDAEWLDVVALA